MTRILEHQIVGYHRPPLTLNQRLHWAVKDRIRRDLHRTAQLQLIGPVRAARRSGVALPLTVTLEWRVTDRRRRDNDNISPTLKVCADVLCGLLDIDDGWMSVTTATRIRMSDRAGLWLLVDDAKEATV